MPDTAAGPSDRGQQVRSFLERKVFEFDPAKKEARLA